MYNHIILKNFHICRFGLFDIKGFSINADEDDTIEMINI